MVEHLPPDSALARDQRGAWGDPEWLLFDLSSRLRELLVLTRNLHRAKHEQPLEVTHLPVPSRPEHDADGDDVPASTTPDMDPVIRAELSALVHRGE